MLSSSIPSRTRYRRTHPVQGIPVADLSLKMKLIVMSDMHRGDGAGDDDFAQNSLIYRCALEYYLENGFNYIELGDAEELWENDNFDQIYITHTPVYELLAKFHDPDPEKTRYIKAWENHDLYWKDNEAIYQSLFPGIQIYEAIILNNSILMIHGHQADPMCSRPVAAVSLHSNFLPVMLR